MKYLHLPHKKRKKGDTARLAAQLAPLEEQDARAAAKQGATVPDLNAQQVSGQSANGDGAHHGASQEHGAIIIDNENLHLPAGVMDGGSGGRTFLGIEPVVLVILVAMLVFTAFIAWQISQMEMPPGT